MKAKKKHKPVDLAATIRAAFKASGLTMYEVAKRADLDRGQVVRFFRQERGVALPAASKLCEVLGLDLVQVMETEDGRGKKGGK